MRQVKIFVKVGHKTGFIRSRDRKPKHLVDAIVPDSHVFTGIFVTAIGFISKPVFLITIFCQDLELAIGDFMLRLAQDICETVSVVIPFLS